METAVQPIVTLAPCPFCGSAPARSTAWGTSFSGPMVMQRTPFYHVLCGTCYSRGAPHETMGEAGASWNRRGIPHTDGKPHEYSCPHGVSLDTTCLKCPPDGSDSALAKKALIDRINTFIDLAADDIISIRDTQRLLRDCHAELVRPTQP